MRAAAAFISVALAIREQRAVTARIRHGGADVPAVITPAGRNRVRVQFLEPPRAAAPGQAIAFYQDDVVVGGAVIDEVLTGDTHARDC